MGTAELDRIHTGNSVALPGLTKTEVLEVEKAPVDFLVYSGIASAAISFITGSLPMALLIEGLNIPSQLALTAMGGFVTLGSIKGASLFARLFHRNAVCIALDEKYGNGTSEHYKAKLFRHTLKAKETVLPVHYGRTSKDKSQLVQTKLITDWKGVRVETTLQENPLAIWDKNASMVKKVYGCKNSNPLTLTQYRRNQNG